MDEATKKKIKNVTDLIRNEKYQQALDEAEIIIYKNSKVYQAHLMAGLCYDKLHKFKQAEKCYLEVLELKPDQPNAIKALCDLYTKMGNVDKSAQYLESMLQTLKKTDPIKYRQNLVKLVEMYQKNEDMEKIDKVFKELLETEDVITEEFVAIAESYFKTGVTNQCFYLQHFLPLGKKGQIYRTLQPSAKQKLNYLLIEIVRYLNSVKLDFKMTNQVIASCIYQMKENFPYASCFLMLFLLDDYCVSQSNYNGLILHEIYLFLTAFYNHQPTCYLNLETLEPECFVVTAVLSYEYLAFMKQFFVLDELFDPFYDRLEAQIPEIENRKVRQQYSQKIAKFILKQCRTVSKISENQNVQDRLQSLKYRIVKLDGSYLEEVVAKMAMNCFVNYQKLCDMKNLLKTRMNNLSAEEVQPHLYKYYYDYLIKIAKLYKSLDEQKSIYDVIKYIYDNDSKDFKYLVEYYWTEIGKYSKTDQFKQVAKENLKNIESILPKLTGSLKSQTIRRQTILKILEQVDNSQILDGFKLALGTDRSFQSLQCIGFYYFNEGDYERALRFFKEAFVIRQDQYHLNRTIFISMIKLKEIKDAYGFLERIYEGFPNVYWINYALAINAINNKRIEAAYKYLSTALQSFMSGISKSFKFSYQKTIEREKYSLIYMIDQNKFHLLSDYIVIPEKKIYELFPMTSSLFFESQVQIKQIRIETQLGEMLKLLGRNKSSYNHLYSAYYMLEQLPEEVKRKNLLQVLSTKKEYATMLFYVRAYKEAEQIFKKTLKICQQYDTSSVSPQLLTMYQSQIHSLLFQVSVMRLDQLMKFQSYQAVEEYINKFTEDVEKLKDLVKRPSLNYYKAKYQFYILCYLHNKKLGVQKSIQTIEQYLKFFGLNIQQIAFDNFYNRLTELKNEERIIVKECLEDYYVLKYMKQNSIEAKDTEKIPAGQLLPLIQLFPTSSVFYIVYGMAIQETKLKIAAFLKCIQLDKQSPISVDLLASLFLKEKDYLTACQLFLKSLQIDLFNTKSYVGLCTCLYVLIGSAIKREQLEDNLIIRKALNKINSYMQFLRIVDPSQNYHMLKFLKTLISDEPIPLFELKAGLEQSRKLTSHKYSQKLLYQLLEDSTQYLKDFNVWKKEGRDQVLAKYLQKSELSSNIELYQIGKSLLKHLEEEISYHQLGQIKSTEIRIKIKCKLLNKLCIIGNLFSKSQQLDHAQLQKCIKICEQLEQNEEIINSQLNKLQKGVKDLIIASLIKSEKVKNKLNGGQLLEQLKILNKSRIFKNLPTFTHIQVYLDHFTQEKYLAYLKRYIFASIHSHPCDSILRKALLSWLLVVEKQNNKNIKKIKQSVDYRLEGALQMNTDENANNTARFHKKYALMFNIQEPNAWVGYIADEWERKKDPKWIEHLQKILRVYQNKENKLTSDSGEKAKWLLMEMSAIKQSKNQKLQILEKQHINIEKLGKIFSNLQNNFSKEKLSSIFKEFPQQNRMNVLRYIVPHLVGKYQNNPKLEKIIDACIDASTTKKTKGFYCLLKFISISSQPTKSQDELIDQLKNLWVIIGQCESEKSVASVHANSLAVMKCMVALLSLNYEQLQLELNNALGNRFVTYSDQVLINYFEIMRVFREVQQNHQGENVFENFTEYVNNMLAMVKEPVLKGFFSSLKAMAGAIIAQESTVKLSKQLKYALLLNPELGKEILKKQTY